MTEISSRCWELETTIKHPETGNTLIELDKIDKTLKNFPQLDSYVSQHFKLILEKNSFKHIRFHDLRHSCASLFLAKGHSLKEIQIWLGHSNFSTTADIYAHLDTSSKKNMAETMSEVGKIALDKTLDIE